MSPPARDKLGITKSTLKTHVRNILDKTGAGELRDVVRWTEAGRRPVPET